MSTLSHLSNQVIRDNNDKRNPGAKVYFYNAGTTTPLTVYADATLSTPLNDSDGKLLADAYGRLPAIYVPYTSGYKVRVVLSTGVVLWETDNIPNPAPVTIDGGAVDPQIVAATGDLWASFATGPRSGWVRLNGNTIGNASSGATERANADTADLFTLLWDNLPNTTAPVVGGRGASAAADFAANKLITLPNAQGRALLGVNGMGGTLANLLSAVAFEAGAQGDLGARVGTATHTLTTAQMPNHAHGGATGAAGSHTHTYNGVLGANSAATGPNFSSPVAAAQTTDAAPNHTHTITAEGGGQAHPNVQPSLTATIYVKL